MSDVIRTWAADGFKLTLTDTGRTDHYGKSVLGYVFSDGGSVIFEGEDFACSPLHSIDSDAAVAGLLSFLSLRPGDTDAEYFESYTPAQLEWADARGEYLSLLAYELEEGAE